MNLVNIMAAIIGSGVLESYPNVKVAFGESGIGWIPYALDRMDFEWEDRFTDLPLKMKPSDYWRRQCYSAVEVDEWSLEGVICTVGDDNLVISSDFPHFDSPFPDARTRFMKIPNVSRESQAKILWDNCATLYNLN